MKKRLLCSLLVLTMCFSEMFAVMAATVSDNTVIENEAAEDETIGAVAAKESDEGSPASEIAKEPDVGGEAAEESDTDRPEPETTAEESDENNPEAETAAGSVLLDVPDRMEAGLAYDMQMVATANTEYAVRIVNKATGKVQLSKTGTVGESSGNSSFVTGAVSVGKNDLPIGDYEVQCWAGSDTYEQAVAKDNVYRKDMVVRNSIRNAVNTNMSAPVIGKAVYTGNAVVPPVTLKETVKDKETVLVADRDYKITVISDNKKELGKARAKIEGIGNYAGSFESDFDIVPQAPPITGVTCVNASSVKVSWNKSANAQGYYIYRRTEGSTFVNVGKVAGNVTTYTDTTPGLDVGATYYYRVDAYAASAVEANREVTSIANEIGVAVVVLPAAPEIVSLESVSTTKLKLTWKKSEEADGYRVYKVTNGKLTRVKDIKSAGTTSVTIKKLSCGYTYQYCVKAYKKNAVGKNIYGNASKNIKAKVTPATPELVSVTSVKATENQVKWRKVSGAYGYYVYRKKSGSTSNWKKIGTVKNGSTLNFIDKNAETGTKYLYTVKAYTKAKVNGKTKTIAGAYDKKGISGKSIPAKTVFTIQQDAKGRGLLINIANVEGASGYYLYRKKGDDKWMKRAVPAQAGDITVYLDRDITAATSYQYYIVPYTQTSTGKVLGTPSDTLKFTTK